MVCRFDRDEKQRLVRAITRVFTASFNEPYYSWNCVPQERAERWFLEFAKKHTWDPLITGTVQQFFESICQKRLKNMVSNARTSGERPKWINETLWKTMQAHWETEEQKSRSETYSTCRKSDRGGLGPHRHVTGPKSYRQIQREMEVELGRPVTLGEVFIRAHTKKDGTYIDLKAERISKTYEKNLEEKKAELHAEISETSDGVSPHSNLSPELCDEIFLQSTEADSQGNLYGLGSLRETVLGKRKQPGECSDFVTLQEQLKEAQRQIAEQAAYNARREAEFAAREAEQARIAEEQKALLAEMTRMGKFMQANERAYLEFISKQVQAEEDGGTNLDSTTPAAQR